MIDLPSPRRFSFLDYQLATRDTAIYPGAQGGSVEAITYLGLGLGEAGEVQGKIKKVLRDDGGKISDEKREAILAELGDVLWYVTRLADELGSSLHHIAYSNAIKLQGRKDRGVLGGSGDER